MAIMFLSLGFIYFVVLRDAQEYYLILFILFIIPNIPYMVNVILQASVLLFIVKQSR